MDWSLTSPAAIVIGLSVVLLAWYFIGSQWNRRRSRVFVRGLAKGFAELNPRPTIQWLGASAFQIHAANPPEPFKSLAVMVVLQPREMLFVWIVNRFRGREDLLVVKGELRHDPRWELELFDLNTPTGREGHRSAEVEHWVITDAPVPPGLGWAYPAVQSDPRPRWTAVLDGIPFRLHRLSIRRAAPHLLLCLTPSAGEFPGELLLRSLVAIGETAAR